jgi:hypothetical protein
MSRLFTFGCSFTHYEWPTWANIVALDRQKELYNFGLAGIGNVGISQRILEADCKFNFTSDDEIMIMWTSWCREDKINEFDYTCQGSVFNKPASIKWFRENWSYIDTIVKNSNAIIYANAAYKKNISWQANAFENDFIESGILPSMNLVKDIDLANRFKKLYTTKLPKFKTIDFLESGNKSFGVLNDSHPDVIDHMNIVLNNIGELKQETKELCNQLQEAIIVELIKSQCLNNPVNLINDILQQDFKNTFYKYNTHEQLYARI